MLLLLSEHKVPQVMSAFQGLRVGGAYPEEAMAKGCGQAGVPRGQERHREYLLNKCLGLGFVVEMKGHFGYLLVWGLVWSAFLCHISQQKIIREGSSVLL